MKAHSANPPTWTSNQEEVHWHANAVLSKAAAGVPASMAATVNLPPALAFEAGGIMLILPPFELPFPLAFPPPLYGPPRASEGALGGG